MKGGGRGKEPPVAGEITGKRPKRKCLQWHPLLSKKAQDFSEEEEEEDEEELEKVSVAQSASYLSASHTEGTENNAMVCELVPSSQWCVARTRSPRCSVEAQKWRRTQVNSGPGGP